MADREGWAGEVSPGTRHRRRFRRQGSVIERARCPVLLACVLVLAGCYRSTLDELRESPATRAAIVPSISYHALAACVMRRLEGSRNQIALSAQYRLFDRPDLKTATVAGSTQMGTDVGWFIEAKFQQREPGSVNVETRKGSWVIGNQTEPITWDAINRCVER